MLNKQKGNMYPWVTHTWNVIKGKCPHDCSYCYMKGYPQTELHFDEKELKTDLGSGNVIFVGSSCDMWADEIPYIWIENVLNHCRNWKNKYLFQSKNPARFINYSFPDCILGTTIESNRYYPEISKAPAPMERKLALHYLPQGIPVMVSIEPIMDFDLDVLVGWIKEIKPEFVSIGADSKGHNLPEPSADKVTALINELKQFTKIRSKNNLNRLLIPRSKDDK
uniref:Radical SAM superfamily protein n=1 Tax=viral metagenome TaxID=1070528 RepID=A0A6M3JVQ0_9ZZZZ